MQNEIRFIAFFRVLLFKICIAAQVIVSSQFSATASTVSPGFNVVHPEALTNIAQNGLIASLRANHVMQIRVGLINDNSLAFIIKAHAAGILTLAIVHFAYNAGAKARAPIPGHPELWSRPGLSSADSEKTIAAFEKSIQTLEASGVRLAGVELANEINHPSFNSDIPTAFDGKTFNYGEIRSRHDLALLRNGLLIYVKIAGRIKDTLNSSSINQQIPLVSAGLADVGDPNLLKPNHANSAGLLATLQYLKDIGLDKSVDAYAIHLYFGYLDAAIDIDSVIKKNTSLCGAPNKACWITEWGFNDNINANSTVEHAHSVAASTIFKAFNEQRAGSIVVAYFYSWSGEPTGTKNSAVFRDKILLSTGMSILNQQAH